MSSEQEVRQRKVRFSAGEDIVVLKEVINVNPYELPSRWQDVAHHARTTSPKQFTSRNVKDRVELLLNTFVKGEKEILKKSGTEEQYSEREHLLEELRTLKESTVKIPRGKRALIQAVRQEGQMLRESAAASMTSSAFVMREEIVDNVIFEWEEVPPETPVSPPPPDLPPPSPYTHPRPSGSRCGAAADRPARSTPATSFSLDYSTPAKRKAALNHRVLQQMEEKRREILAMEKMKNEVEMMKAMNERQKLDLLENRFTGVIDAQNKRFEEIEKKN